MNWFYHWWKSKKKDSCKEDSDNEVLMTNYRHMYEHLNSLRQLYAKQASNLRITGFNLVLCKMYIEASGYGSCHPQIFLILTLLNLRLGHTLD